MSFTDIIGYIPAIIFPAATIIQLVYLLKAKNADGVSATTWFAFALGNISLYIYTEKYWAIQSILGQLVTALIQLYIVFLIWHYRKQSPSKS
jgi:lipid-A-disaccharide synthase-like uncharacterized protein